MGGYAPAGLVASTASVAAVNTYLVRYAASDDFCWRVPARDLDAFLRVLRVNAVASFSVTRDDGFDHRATLRIAPRVGADA